MKRLHVHVGLRLMLLIVALCCVLFAALRAFLDLRRDSIRTEIMNLEARQQLLENSIKYNLPANPKLASELKHVNAQLAEKQKQTGDTRNFTKDFHQRAIQRRIEGLQRYREQWMEMLRSETNPDAKIGQQKQLDWFDAEIIKFQNQKREMEY